MHNHGDAPLVLGRVEDALAAFEAGLEDAQRMGLALSYGIGLQANMVECECAWVAAAMPGCASSGSSMVGSMRPSTA